jgi:biotin-(acetyl-CoA carboxylase) ligase
MLSNLPETALVLPPLYSARSVVNPRLVFATASAKAAEAGAGTLFHGEDEEIFAFAVVLEPEQILVEARFAFFAGMAALGDALAAHCPPERAIAFDWPDAILYDLALLGGGRLAWPSECAEDAVPDWLVFGVELNAGRPGLNDSGRHPNSTSLVEEEFTDSGLLIESFSRHLMRYFDAWSNEGTTSVTAPYLERLRSDHGHDRLLDGRGDLLEREAAGATVRRRALVEGLAGAEWYDAARQGPKL